VVVNSDTSQAGFSNLFGDWIWRRDGQRLRTRVSTDFTPPRIRSRSPGAERHGVSRRARVRVRFSERLLVLNTRTVTLRDRRGHAVKARLKARGGHSLTLAPRRPLRPHSRYKVTLSSTIRDLGGYALPAGSRSWHFRTRR
jgi:hypothetical protein